MSRLLHAVRHWVWGSSASVLPDQRPRGTRLHRYTWRPDLPDHRDKWHPVRPIKLWALATPAQVDWRAQLPPVYDQGQLGSCTANAVAAVVAYDEHRQHLPNAMDVPSRLFIYWNERHLEGTEDRDSGASIRDSIKAVHHWGYCRETTWPYNVAAFQTQPPAEAYTEAQHHKAVEYRRVPGHLNTLLELLAEGQLIVLGISVYESLESPEVARTGDVPLPSKSESLLGGHAIVLVGYDTARMRFIWRNSWGPQWGQQGYGTLPFDYVTNKDLATDMWTVSRVSESDAPTSSDAVEVEAQPVGLLATPTTTVLF